MSISGQTTAKDMTTAKCLKRKRDAEKTAKKTAEKTKAKNAADAALMPPPPKSVTQGRKVNNDAY